jgi:hypothetical protein
LSNLAEKGRRIAHQRGSGPFEVLFVKGGRHGLMPFEVCAVAIYK